MYICTKIILYRDSKGIGNEILDLSEEKESKCSKTATYDCTECYQNIYEMLEIV